MKSLDIGAGIGNCMISLQNAGFDSYGFEPSQPSYERAISKMNIHLEVPSSAYLAARIINFYYRLTGTNYVCNLSPRHAPFHWYEFRYKSFSALSEQLGFTIKYHKYTVGVTVLLPKFIGLAKNFVCTNDAAQVVPLSTWDYDGQMFHG